MPRIGSDTRTVSEATHWIVPLRTLSIVMGVFGFSCLGVLVVVSAVESKDALSTVALALAILAFSVQLIVFVAQQSLAGEQGRRNEELYGSMQGVLAEIREKTAGTQAEVQTMSRTMLKALISKDLADQPGEKVDPNRLMSQLAAAGAQTVDGSDERGERSRIIWPDRRPTPEDESFVQTLESFPAEDEVGDTLAVLKGLSTPDRSKLKRFGADEIISLGPDSPFDPSWTEDAVGGLAEHGLVEPYPHDRQPPGGPRIFHLTDRGRNVARLLTAPGEPPDYLPALEEIRKGVPEPVDWLHDEVAGVE